MISHTRLLRLAVLMSERPCGAKKKKDDIITLGHFLRQTLAKLPKKTV